MVVSNGYSIMQDVMKNKLLISLPQTQNSITGTQVKFSGRRKTITAEEEFVLLHIIMAMYEGEYSPESGADMRGDRNEIN